MSMATPEDLEIFPECQKDFLTHSFSHLSMINLIECVSWSSIISMFLLMIFSYKFFLFFLSAERPFIFKDKTDSPVSCLSCLVSILLLS